FEPRRTVIVHQVASVALRGSEIPRLVVCQSTEFDRPIAAAEIGHRVMVRVFSRELMGCARLQMQLQLALTQFGNYNRILCESEARSALSTRFREKHAVPLRPAGRDVVDVED